MRMPDPVGDVERVVWPRWPQKDAIERRLRDAEVHSVLLRPNPRRFVLFPIQHYELWEQYKTIEHSFWVAEELDMQRAHAALSALPDPQQELVALLLDGHLQVARAAPESGIVELLSGEIQAAEARCYFGFQGMLEAIHVEALGSLVACLPSHLLPPTNHAPPLAPFFALCTSPEYTFMRRLLAYAVFMHYLHACTLASAALLRQHDGIAALFQRICRDLARFAAFSVMLCRQTLPPDMVHGPWSADFVHALTDWLAHALLDLARPHGGTSYQADTFLSAIRNNTPPATRMSTPLPQKDGTVAHEFRTDVDF